jgi:hypothetical protein
MSTINTLNPMKIIKWMPFLCLVILSGCSKEKNNTAVDNWSATPVTSEISKFLATTAINADSITIKSTDGGTVTNNGISVDIPVNAFAKADGSAFSGNALIKLQTIRTVKDMVYSGITAVSDKGLLESGGMINILAYDSERKPLKLNTGITLTANFPVGPFTFGFPSVFKGQPVTANANKITWSLWGTLGPDGITIGPVATPFPNSNGIGPVIVTGLDAIFTWTNLDSYITSASPLTDITVTLPNGFSNLNTECCFNYAGINSCSYLYANAPLKAFSTKGSSYKVIKGRAANVIVLAKRNGLLYAQVISIAKIGDDQTVNADNLKETTADGIKAILTNF